MTIDPQLPNATTVPAAVFDNLVEELDTIPQPNPTLARAAQKAREIVPPPTGPNPTNGQAAILDHHIPNTVETITYNPTQDPDMTTTLHIITPHMKQAAFISIILPNGTPLMPPQPLTEFLQQVHEILEQQRCDPQ